MNVEYATGTCGGGMTNQTIQVCVKPPLPTGPVCRVFTQTGRCDRASRQRVSRGRSSLNAVSPTQAGGRVCQSCSKAVFDLPNLDSDS